ncbi:MAG: hypothetical protein JNM69_38975 [Archangium sp.]|nr:hypothetical protein [Archangium sp.]
MSLSNLLHALDSGQPHHALRMALETWRTTHHPTVAAIVHQLGERARTTPASNAQWLEVARRDDPTEVEWLIERLRVGVPVPTTEGPNDVHHATWSERLLTLAARAPDPRLAQALLGFFVTPTLALWAVGTPPPIFRGCGDALMAMSDPRCVEPLRVSPPHGTMSFAREMQLHLAAKVAEHLAATVVVDPPDLSDWEALLTRLVPAPPAQAAHLLASVQQAPEQLDVRAVYADVLSQAADPRGTFIALQLAARTAPSPENERQQHALLSKHEKTWLGPLHGLVDVEWRDGFPTVATLRSRTATDAAWAAAAADERVSTLTSVRQGGAPLERFVEFLHSPRLTNLRELDLSVNALRRLNAPVWFATLERLTAPSTALNALSTLEPARLPRLHWLTLATKGARSLESVLEAGAEVPLVRAMERLRLHGLSSGPALVSCVERSWPEGAWPVLELGWHHRFSRRDDGLHYAVVSEEEQAAVRYLQTMTQPVRQVTLLRLPDSSDFMAQKLENEAAARGVPFAVERVTEQDLEP